jgi:hypothetical protein
LHDKQKRLPSINHFGVDGLVEKAVFSFDND